jgi:hypothetical protein
MMHLLDIKIEEIPKPSTFTMDIIRAITLMLGTASTSETSVN